MQSKKDQVIRTLMEWVKSGEYTEGSQLPSEKDLAQKLGIGRNLLREAVASLEALGIVEVRERQGIFVRKLPLHALLQNFQAMHFWPEDFIYELMEMRRILEVAAAELAASRRTEEDLKKLRTCFFEFSRALPVSLEGKHAGAKWESLLHEQVVSAAHNTLLSRIYEGLSFVIEENRDLLHVELVREADWFDHIASQHLRMIDAIEARNAEEAARASREHIEDTIRRIRKPDRPPSDFRED